MKACEINGFTKNELLEMSWEKPPMAQIALTKNCNQRCIFCFRACEPSKVFSELSLDDWKTILLKCKNIGIRKLNFSGGEVFIYHDFIKLLEWVKNKHFEIIINTNGLFDVSEAVSYADEIIFSVHGIGSKHNEIVGEATKSFKMLESNIVVVSESHVKLSINMVLIHENYDQIENVFDYLNSRYKIFKFSPTLAIKSLAGSQFVNHALEIDEKLIKDYVSRLGHIPPKKLQLKHGFQSIFFSDFSVYNAPIPLPNCAAGKYKIIVEHDGEVYPCNYFKSQDFYCGNMLKDDEHKIWETGKGFNRFRELVLQESVPEKCQSCMKKPKCFSGCRAWAEQYQKGGFENVADHRCELGNAFVGS